MDFRKVKWSSSPVSGDTPLEVKPEAPENGFLAYYIQATYPALSGLLPYSLSSQITALSAE